MKPAELRELTVEELAKQAEELREKLFRLRIRNRLGQLESPGEIRKTRRDLARVLTILREKSAAAPARETAGRNEGDRP